jgi:Family of unknown function (DUF6599)
MRSRAAFAAPWSTQDIRGPALGSLDRVTEREEIMHRHTQWHATWLGLGLLLAVVAGGCGGGEPEVDESIEPTGPFAEIQKKVPKSLDLTGWKRSGKMTIVVRPGYTAPTGAQDVPAFTPLEQSDLATEAKLLTEYKYEAGVVQMFEQEEGTGRIRLEIHQTSTGSEAYGLVTVAAAGQSGIGTWTAMRKSPGKMVFAKERYFVRIMDTSAGANAPGANDKIIADIARAITMKIFGMRMPIPREMQKLPLVGRVKDSEVYVHGPVGLALAEKKLGAPLVRVLGPVLGNAPLVAAKYTASGGGDNVVFIMNRRMATEVPPLTQLDAHVGNDFAYSLADTRYVVVGTFNPEEESLQRVVARIEATYTSP